MKKERLLTEKQVAERLGCSRSYVNRFARRHKWTITKLDPASAKTTRYLESEIDEFISGRVQAATGEANKRRSKLRVIQGGNAV